MAPIETPLCSATCAKVTLANHRILDLKEALKACVSDLEALVNQQYQGPASVHPAMRAKYERDMLTVVNAKAALDNRARDPAPPAEWALRAERDGLASLVKELQGVIVTQDIALQKISAERDAAKAAVEDERSVADHFSGLVAKAVKDRDAYAKHNGVLGTALSASGKKAAAFASALADMTHERNAALVDAARKKLALEAEVTAHERTRLRIVGLRRALRAAAKRLMPISASASHDAFDALANDGA